MRGQGKVIAVAVDATPPDAGVAVGNFPSTWSAETRATVITIHYFRKLALHLVNKVFAQGFTTHVGLEVAATRVEAAMRALHEKHCSPGASTQSEETRSAREAFEEIGDLDNVDWLAVTEELLSHVDVQGPRESAAHRRRLRVSR